MLRLPNRLYDEPERLLSQGEYRAAVIFAITLLEKELHEVAPLFEETQRYEERRLYHNLRSLLKIAVDSKLISTHQWQQLQDWIPIRNRLVHTSEEIGPANARKIVKGVMKIIQKIRDIAAKRYEDSYY